MRVSAASAGQEQIAELRGRRQNRAPESAQTVNAAMERKKARTAGRSDLARRALTVEVRDDISIILETSSHRPQYHYQSGTRTDSTISRRTFSVVSDFFCSEAWRALATYAVGKDGPRASCLKSSGRQKSRPSKKCPRLGGALQHEGATRADSQCELIGFARAVHYLQRVIVQA